jgi:hypothetical protein
MRPSGAAAAISSANHNMVIATWTQARKKEPIFGRARKSPRSAGHRGLVSSA